MLLADFVMSHWQPADRDQFADVWKAELADIPDYETSTLHMASGLLLPIWRLLPKESSRVYRLQTDEGERSEEHTSELQSLMRISYAVFCLKKKKIKKNQTIRRTTRQHNNNNRKKARQY